MGRFDEHLVKEVFEQMYKDGVEIIYHAYNQKEYWNKEEVIKAMRLAIEWEKNNKNRKYTNNTEPFIIETLWIAKGKK